MPSKTFQARHWCFTIFDLEWLPHVNRLYAAAGEKIWDPSIRYIIFQLEQCPSNGRAHYQGYVEFHKAKRVTGVQDALRAEKCHVEPRAGTREEAQHYCMKPVEGCVCKHCANQEEKGLRVPDTPTYSIGEWIENQGARTDLKKVVEDVKRRRPILEMANDYPVLCMQRLRQIKELQKALIPPRNSSEPVEVLVIWGKTGAGKSRRARELAGNDYCKIRDTDRGWVDDEYVGQKALILDDFHWKMDMEVFKNLTDRHEFKAETKGGFVQIAATKIIITSNWAPEEWYPLADPRDKAAVLRRIARTEHLE